MMNAREERRFRIFDVDQNQIIPILNLRIGDQKIAKVPMIPAIPEGADLIELVNDPNYMSLGIVVAHPSFAPVRLGDSIPRIGANVEWEHRIIKVTG